MKNIYTLIKKSFGSTYKSNCINNFKKHHVNKVVFLKTVLTAFIFLLTISRAQSATYFSRANAAWNVASTWSTVAYGGAAAAAFPKAGDIVNIGNGNTITVSANAACASITIDATGVLNPTGSVTVNATTGITINGTYNNQSTGKITTPSWICNGTYNHANSSATLPKGNTTTSWAAVSNCNITGSYTSAIQFINFIGQTFGNFTFNPSAMTKTVCLYGGPSGIVTIQGNFTITKTGSSTLYLRQVGFPYAGTLNINGNFSMAAGTFDLHNGGTAPTTSVINLKGNFTLSGTSNLKQTTTQSGSTVNFNFTGSGVQTVNISPTASISSQGTTASCAIKFAVASGSTIDMGTSVLTGTNNTSFNLSAGATIITANTGGLSSSGATGSIQVNGPRTYSPTANYIYNSTVAGQVTGNGLTAANNLTISNTTSSGVTFSNPIAISGNLNVTTGAHVNLGPFPSTLTTTASLTLGGVNQPTGTSYGGAGSAAVQINTTYFNAATGILGVSLQPPTNLSYNTPVTFLTNALITEQDPTVTGVVTSYAISPSLPAGLSFNTTTGAITGTPTVSSPATTYTVTATNGAGNTTCNVIYSVGNNRYAVVSGNWNATSTWSLASGGVSGAPVPVSGDLVFIGETSSSYTVTIPSGYAAECGSLTMGDYSDNTVAILNFTDGTSSLVVGNDLFMNRPNATATSEINVNTGSLTVGGTLKLANSDLTPDASTTLINRVNISTGTVTTANLLFNGQSAAQSQIVFSGAGTLNISGNLTFGYILGTLTPSTGTVNFNGSLSAQNIPIGISNVIYNNLTINNTNSGGATLSDVISGADVTGNLYVGNINSGSTFDNGGFAIVLASGKSFNVANGSTFNLSGTSTMLTVLGGGTKTFGATSTVNYRGSAQTVSAESYGHLTLSGSGIKTLPASTITLAGNYTMSGTASATALAAINTAGNFTLGSGTSFNASSFTHTVGGNWTNSGTFTSGSSTIDFNGSGAGNIGASNFNNITFSGAGTKTATGALTIDGNVNINNNFSAGSYTHTIIGNWTNSGTYTHNSGTVIFGGTGAQTINSGANSFNNFSISNTGGTCTASGNGITVAGTFTTNSGTTLDLATYALSVNTVSHSGTLLTQNTSSTPITTGKTWGGLVSYNSNSTAQTAMAGTYNNLTITTTGGAAASGNINVNGILNLAAANPSSTKGCLEMVTDYSTYPGTTNSNPGVNTLVSYYLKMGSTATTIGVGDVTGIVKRTTILANTSYSFGNQYTTVALTAGTMPDSLTVTIKIGSEVPNKTSAIKRHYEIVPFVPDPNTFTSTSRFSVNFHYLDSELNGNTESRVITGDYDIDGGSPTPDEHGRSAYDFTNNYIGLSNVAFNYFLQKTGHMWRTIFLLSNHETDYKTWNGSASTDWDEETNWTPSGIPNVGHFVIIPDAATTPNDPILPSNPGTIINTLTIEAGGILVMGSQTLSISNSLSAGWEDQNPNGNDPGTSTVIFTQEGATVSGTGRFYNLTINSGASLTNAAGSSVKIENAITKTGAWYCHVYDNTVEYNKGGNQTVVIPDDNKYYNLTLSESGTKDLPALTMIQSNLTFSGSVTTTTSSAQEIVGNVTIGTGTTFTAGTFTHTVGGNWTKDGTFTATGSTIEFNGDNAGNIGASNFNNITFSGAGTKTATGILSISGNVNISNNFTAGSLSHTVGGNWTNSGIFTATGSTIDFNGSDAGNIGASNFNHIIFSGAGTKTATGALSIAGNVNISNNFTAGSLIHTVGGNWTNSGTFTASGSNIDFNGSGTGNIGTSNFNDITFSGAGTKTATGILSVTGNVNILNNFIAGSLSHTVGGNWTNSGTFTATGSTIDFNASGVGNIGTSNFNNITLSGEGTKIATGVLSIAANVNISNNFTAGSLIHTVGGNWTNSGTFTATGSTIDFNGDNAGNIGTSNFNNISFSGVGTKTATGVLSVAADVIILNNFTAGSLTHTVGGNWTNIGTFIATGSTIDFNGSGIGNVGASNFNHISFSGSGTKFASDVLSIAGNVNISNNFTAETHTHTVGGNWTNSGTFTATGSTIDFNGSGAGNIGASNFNNIAFSGGGTKTAAGILSIAGDLTILNNFVSGNYSHTIGGNFTNFGTFTSDAGTFTFNGAATQTIISGGDNFFNVIFYNTTSGNSDINITDPMTITNSGTFTDGVVVISGSGSLTFTNIATSTVGSANSFVDGPVIKDGNTAFTFPIGDNDLYAPISISAANGGGSATDYFTANYFNENPGQNYNLNAHDASIHNISKAEYWTLERSGTNEVNVTLSWDTRSGGITSVDSLIVAHWDGAKWTDAGKSTTTGDTNAGTITSNLVSNFSPFTIGSTGVTNPLPVSLILFEGSCNSSTSSIKINWTTASETNNDYFTIERCTNYTPWEIIDKVKGAGNSNTNISYSINDNLEGIAKNIDVLHYRLMQTDYDGNSDYFDVISIPRCFPQEFYENSLYTYPNPFSNEVNISYYAPNE
ncbi:MAG: hypothetical protein HGB12_04910, partial [Bacteroidetes bacterium]|nr:hypothetical protein [Bacteroidota bacterium]